MGDIKMGLHVMCFIMLHCSSVCSKLRRIDEIGSGRPLCYQVFKERDVVLSRAVFFAIVKGRERDVLLGRAALFATEKGAFLRLGRAR